MDPNTASKIRGCFIGIPGKRGPRPVERVDMDLTEVVADLGFILSTWWSKSESRPEIANSDRSFWGMLHASDVLGRIERFLNGDGDSDADTFLICYCGHGSKDGGEWCCDDNSYVSFEQIVDLWQSSTACLEGHRLILYVDSCFSGHWAIKAQHMSLPNIIVQTACSSTETTFDGIFTKVFVDFQNSQGTVRPSSQQMYSRTPLVYVPWSQSDTVIYKDVKGKANRRRPYMFLLSDPQHELRAWPPVDLPTCAPAASDVSPADITFASTSPVSSHHFLHPSLGSVAVEPIGPSSLSSTHSASAEDDVAFPPQWLLRLIKNNDPALTELNDRHVIGYQVQAPGRQYYRLLADALLHNTCITSLNLSRCLVGSEGSQELCRALMHATALWNLDLRESDLKPEGVYYICQCFPHLTSITHMDLSGNGLSAGDGTCICSAAAAAGMTRLLYLNLGYCEHMFRGAEQLCMPHRVFEILQDYNDHDYNCADLVHFLMCKDRPFYVSIPELPLHWLVSVESNHPALTEFHFLDSKCDGVAHPKGKFQLTISYVETLSRALMLNTRLTSLNLSRAEMGTVGLLKLQSVFKHLTTLTELDLSYSALTSSGCSFVCSALTHLSALSKLNLRRNELTADDGALICAAAAAAGMTRLKTLRLDENGFELSDVFASVAWWRLNLPQPPREFVSICTVSATIQYLISSDRNGFVETYIPTHPDLPPELLLRIESNDPDLAELRICGDSWESSLLVNLKEAGCHILAQSLLCNTCITSLILDRYSICDSGLRQLLPALTHLTTLTRLDLLHTELGSDSVSTICCFLPQLTHLARLCVAPGRHELNFGLVYPDIANMRRQIKLTADDGVRICCAAAAAGMHRLQCLELGNFLFRDDSVPTAWKQLRLPPLPYNFCECVGWAGLVHYIMSPDRTVFIETCMNGLKPWLLQLIETSHPAFTRIKLQDLHLDKVGTKQRRQMFDEEKNHSSCGEPSFQYLLQALSRNTCITSLDLSRDWNGQFQLNKLQCLQVFLAVTHLTTLDDICFDHRSYLDANDAARICHTIVTKGMTRLKRLGGLDRLHSSEIVASDEWKRLGLPQPPNEIGGSCDMLLMYLMSGLKVPPRTLRMIFAGKTSLVKALMSPSSKCDLIDASDRTVAIDLHDMQLFAAYGTDAPPVASSPVSACTSRELQAKSYFQEGQLHEAHGVCTEALRCYGEAVALGHVEAHAPLSFILLPIDSLKRVGVEFDVYRALDTAEAGRLLGCFHCKAIVAWIMHNYSDCFGKSNCHQLLQESIDSGSPYGLFIRCMLPDGIAHIGSLAPAVEQKFMPALILMAEIFWHGDCGFLENRTYALDIMKRAAAQGFESAKSTLLELQKDGIDVRIWDLAGQDVYTLSHSVHFSYRCLYTLLWKPFESLDTTMRLLKPWLELLCMRVPDAHIVLVASHCKTNITDQQFLALSIEVEAAVCAKVQELNDITRLEVDSLRTRLARAEQERQRLEDDYSAHVRSTPELERADIAFSQQHPRGAGNYELFAARADSDAAALPRSLRSCAAKVRDVIVQERSLCERLQLLLGIHNGARPDDRDACKMTLHCKSVDSVDGHGISELKTWLREYCTVLPFMDEMIPISWIDVANVFCHFGDSVLSRYDAIALVRRHMPNVTRLKNLNDDEIWSIFEFWSSVGRIFVYESQVVRDPNTLIALLKPLLHHEPLAMMRLPSYQTLIVANSLKNSSTCENLQRMLGHLQKCDELNLELLDHLSAWKDLSPQQRISMLAFFESSRILSQLHQKPNVRLISARSRAKPFLCEVERVAAASKYHALYLVPFNSIGISAHLHSAVSSMNVVGLNCISGRDSLYLERSGSECTFSVEDFSDCMEQNARFSCLRSQLGVTFSCVMRVASNDFGMFKFAAALVDDAMDSCRFGSRFQCWVTVIDDDSLGCGASWVSRQWWQFGVNCSTTLNKFKLSTALQSNQHEHVTPGKSIVEIFQPRCSIFISHAWGDGTGEFIKRLQKHLEQKTQRSVWVDTDGLNQQQQILDLGFRNALCLARVVFIVLTPTYLTRPNCLRELRWALDLERAGHLTVVLLELHPAMTYDSRQTLVKDGPAFGLVFSVKEKKVKRLCSEAIALVKRFPNFMNTLPWHELEAWRSDELKDDWEEHRKWGTNKHVFLTDCENGLIEQTISGIMTDRDGCPWLNRVSSREVNELNAKADKCVTMDDNDALTASDVDHSDVPSDWMTIERYPETAFHLVQRGDAAWEPDDKRDSCPGCGKRFKLLLNPRHHCRKCGKVVCDGCAPVRERVGGHHNVRCCVAWCNSP